MANETGGAAFPHDEFSESSEQYRALNYQHPGMTLRDYFAAKALPALVAQEISFEYIAKEAYRYADLMLAERAK